METFNNLFSNETIRTLVVLGLCLLIGVVLHFIFIYLLKRVSKRTETVLDDAAARHCRGPMLLFFILLMIYIGLPLMVIPSRFKPFLRQSLSILLIIAVGWLVIRFTKVFWDVVHHRFDVGATDNLRARKVHTQYNILSKIIIVATIVIVFASILMTFDSVRRIGAGLLASAGVVGIIVGFSAQKSLATLFAGIQVALTQPIRLDDVVIVEGEWGRIEEITLTYVVVKIWDQRRLIVPISYFLEKPFQNWTRVSAEILGTVFLRVDVMVPIDAIRAEVVRLCEEDERWDGRVAGLVMTDVGESTVELRALLSAADASKAWDLRCEVREKLVEFIKNKYPEGLPRFRAEISPFEEGIGRA